MPILLHEIRPGSVAYCSFSPAGCPLKVCSMVLRLPDGTFDPPIPDHPTFKDALFVVISVLLEPKDFKLLRKVQVRWDDQNFTDLKWAPLYVARIIGRIRRHELDLRNENVLLDKVKKTF